MKKRKKKHLVMHIMQVKKITFVMGSGGSTNGKSSKLPIILGVVSPVAFVLVAYVFIAIILANRRKVRLQALAMPTSTGIYI